MLYIMAFTALLVVVFSVIPSSAQAAPLCPIESDGRRTIIRFDGSIISGSGGLKQTSAFVTSIPAGTYDITLVSFDEHSGEATQSAEQWFLFMASKAGSPVGWSKEIGDLPDGQQFLIQTVNLDYGVTEAISAVTASHITVYDSGQHSIIPVCAAFDLKDGSPLVTTDTASSIESDRALIEGNVNPNGSSNAVWWFEWGTTTFPLASKTPERRIANSEHISERITGLKKNTQYFFRAAARNAANTSFGPTLSFITGGGPVQISPSPSPLPCSACPGLSQPISPTTVTQLPTFVAQNTAVLNGHVTADVHLGTSVWFEWGTNANLGFTTTRKSAGHISSADFSDSLTGLLPNTIYYFRSVAENTKARSHGVTFLFRTLPIPISEPVQIIQISQTPVPTPRAPIIYNPTPTSRAPITSFDQSLGLVALAIKPSDEVIEAGTIVPFEITFENISNDLLTNAVLTIMLPPELVYQDMSGSPADMQENTSINGSLNLITVKIGDIVKGKKESMNIRALLKSDTIDRKVFTTSAVITYENKTIGKGGKETVFAINTASAYSGFGALLFAGGFLTWFFLGLIGLLFLLLIFFLLKRRKEEEEKRGN